MESLKINYLLLGTGRTGGTRVLFNFMNELTKLGHQVSITTFYYDKWFPLSPDIQIISKKTKFDLALYYGMGKISNKNSIGRLVNLLNKLGEMVPVADVNVATFSPTAYLASWKSVEGATPFYHMQHFETIFFKDLVMKKFIYDTYFLPIYKVANSLWLHNQLIRSTGFDYPILNPAIEHEIFYPREKYNDERSINIVALGKGGWKNALGIYKAVELVRSQIKDRNIVLHYFGHRPPENIQFDGKGTLFHKDLNDEDLAKLYSSSDIQITFSKAESFPLPPLEAMACGAAVITTPYGTEDYAIDGENSLVVKPDDIHMLADSIKKLILDEQLRNKLQMNGIKTAKKFTYENQAKILERHIKLALDENSKRDYGWKAL